MQQSQLRNVREFALRRMRHGLFAEEQEPLFPRGFDSEWSVERGISCNRNVDGYKHGFELDVT